MADFDSKAFFGGLGKGAGKFAAKHGLIGVVAEFDVRGALRNPDGTYTAFQGNVLEANRRLVVELADSVAAAAKQSMLRPNVSTGRLQHALLSEKNREVTKEGYGVGRPEFLDESEAKYWRQIDQGYSGHVGREIRGVFGGSLTGVFGGQSPYGPYPIAGEPFTGIGQGTGGRLLPAGRKTAYALLGKQRRGGKGLGIKSVIGEPIAPQRYFERGWEEFDAKRRTTEVVKEELSKAFGNKGVPTRALIRSASQSLKAPLPPSPGKRFKP